MNTQQSTSTFAIIGGGIAGLTAAIALKRIGVDATIIEASNEFDMVGAGIVLAPNALKAYQYLDVYDELIKTGNPIRQMSIYNQRGKLLSRNNTETYGKGLFSLSIHRAMLHRILLTQLDESFIIKGKRSKSILDRQNGFEIVFEDGSSVMANYIIAADGIHSPVRQQYLPQSTKRYSGYICWRGVTNVPGLKLREASETWGKNGRFGIVPLGNEQIYWFAVKNADINDQHIRSLKRKDLLELYKGYADPIAYIIQSASDDEIFCNDIYDLKPVEKYAFGNIVLIGDAAHATTPNLGQGACQAIEDAVVLVKCLQENSIVHEAFLYFEEKRIKRTHSVVDRSWMMGKVAQWDNATLAGLRNTILRIIPDSVINKQLQDLYKIDF